ncbi:MAG: leucine-rich repeat protein [Clostridia bacterium]|nr:leucine-rich repeat protein [Clostridia bacterium]
MKKVLSIVLALTLVIGVFVSASLIAGANDTENLTYTLNDEGTGYIVSGCKTDAVGDIVIPATYRPEIVAEPVLYNEGETEPAGDEIITEESTTEKVEEPSSEEESTTEKVEEPSSEVESTTEKVEEPSSEEESTTEKAEEPSSEVESTTEKVEETKYDIVIDDKIQNGSVATDKFSAVKGDEVTLVITPAEDYILRELVVTDEKGEKITVTNNKFTMPEGNVNVTATFIPAELPVVAIADEAFKNCGKITSVTIPASVISIGKNAFVGCKELVEFKVDGANKNFKSYDDGVIYNSEVDTIVAFPIAFEGKTYAMPETVKNIAEGAFPGSALKNVKYVFTLQKELKIAENNEALNLKGVLHLGMKDHTKDEGTKTPSDCKFNGQILYKCTVCELEMDTVILPLDPENHTVGEWEVKEEATCEKAGTEVKKCTLCEKELETREIEILAHTIEEWETVLEPTCIEKGSKKGVCTVCETEVTEELAVLEHTHQKLGEEEATCEKAGYTGDTYCNDCKKIVVSGEEIPALPHTVEEWEVTKAPTCLEVGEKTGVCTVCENEVKEDVEAINHKNASIVGAKESTCEEEGYTGDKVCPDCEEILETGETIDKLGHNVEEWDTETNKPTCTEKGSKSGICTRCEETVTEEVAALDHAGAYLKDAKDPTCVEDGYTGDMFCPLCETVLTEGEVIDKLGHNVEEWETVTEATCTEAGEKTGKCTVCEENVTDVIPATNHPESRRVNSKDATCTEAGHTGYLYCPDCKKILDKGEEIPALPHTVEEWEVTTPATCTEEGVKTGKCTVCGKEDVTAVVEKIAHTEADGEVITQPTCFVVGERKVVCSVCGENLGTKEIPATNHANYELLDAKEATCTEEGYTGDKLCLDCIEIVEVGEVIPAKGHTESEWITEKYATCTETGTKYTECTVCEEKIKEDLIPATGHNFVNNVCKNEGCAIQEFDFHEIEGSAIIIGYNGTGSVVTIPEKTNNGAAVKAIRNYAFKDATFSTVIIPSTVTMIGSEAFISCENLKYVRIPDTVTTSIGDYAFGYDVTIAEGAEGEEPTKTYTKYEDFVIYGNSGYAASYAETNGFTYIDIDGVYTVNEEKATAVKDYVVVEDNEDGVADVVTLNGNYTATVEASYVYQDVVLYGTGSVITVYDENNNIIDRRTVVVRGDVNGDGVCDVLDCMIVQLDATENISLENAYLVAGDFDGMNGITDEDYSAVVNAAKSRYESSVPPVDETEPEVTEPEVTEPEVTEPEVTEPEVTEPETTEPETTEPETTEPEENE